eukprot:symbB.v1.2.023626.t1/scaffold2176.1/size86939/5
MREVADQVLPKFGRQIDIPLPIDRAHPSCPESGSLCSTKVLTMERLEGVPIRQYAIPLMKMFAEAHGTSWDELKRILESKDMTKVDLENPAVRRVLRMGEVTEWQSRLLALGIQLRNCTGRMVGGWVDVDWWSSFAAVVVQWAIVGTECNGRGPGETGTEWRSEETSLPGANYCYRERPVFGRAMVRLPQNPRAERSYPHWGEPRPVPTPES